MQLKAKRKEIASSVNIPAYVIFHDKTLIRMAKSKPKSLEEMLEISGVGESKLDKYGEDFLKVINNNNT